MKMYETRTAELTINGIEGTLTQIGYGVSSSYSGRPGTKNQPGTWHKQTWVSKPRTVEYDGRERSMVVKIRYDDECRNGHNSFAITGSIGEEHNGICGSIHEEIRRFMPELAPFIKWHSMNVDGPMHYLANTTFLAGNRDCRGKLKGEPWAWDMEVLFEDFPFGLPVSDRMGKWLDNLKQASFSVHPVPHKDGKYPDHFTLAAQMGGVSEVFTNDWTYAKFRTEGDALRAVQSFNRYEWRINRIPTLFSEGKERELELARRAAIWPEATDEQLCLPKDELIALLEARLPALIEAFKADITAAGLAWEPEPETVE